MDKMGAILNLGEIWRFFLFQVLSLASVSLLIATLLAHQEVVRVVV